MLLTNCLETQYRKTPAALAAEMELMFGSADGIGGADICARAGCQAQRVAISEAAIRWDTDTVSSFRAAASLFFGPRVIGMSPDCAHDFAG